MSLLLNKPASQSTSGEAGKQLQFKKLWSRAKLEKSREDWFENAAAIFRSGACKDII